MKAFLELSDGSRFEGVAFGAAKSIAGEVVFTTSMVGYPESMTDPSYRGQLLCFTYPLIGNYGVPQEQNDMFGFPDKLESRSIHVAGIILANPPKDHNHWNAGRSLEEWMLAEDIPGIAGIDTRALTTKLREHGVMLGKIVVDKDVPFSDPNERNLVAEVSTKKQEVYGKGDVTIGVLDCGVKLSIIRALLKRNSTVIRIPWDSPIPAVDGLLISNGPGNPALLEAPAKHIREFMKQKKPILGVCLGNQILAHAAGGKTFKLKYGHRSHNQPCTDLTTGKCYVTSQNHGFAVEKPPQEFLPWWVNANDNTNEGIRHATLPFKAVQFHPEARGGPLDTEWIFDAFLKEVRE